MVSNKKKITREVDGKRMGKREEVVGRRGEKKPWSWASKRERETIRRSERANGVKRQRKGAKSRE